MEAHAMHLPAVVLAGESMRGLVDEGQNQEEYPEFSQVARALFGEGVVLQRVVADLTPAAGKNKNHEGEQQKRQSGEPGRVHPAQPRIKHVEETVGIPGGELDMRDIAPFGLAVLVLMAILRQLLVQGNVLLLRSLVPEV